MLVALVLPTVAVTSLSTAEYRGAQGERRKEQRNLLVVPGFNVHSYTHARVHNYLRTCACTYSLTFSTLHGGRTVYTKVVLETPGVVDRLELGSLLDVSKRSNLTVSGPGVTGSGLLRVFPAVPRPPGSSSHVETRGTSTRLSRRSCE